MSVPGLIKDIYSRTIGGVAPAGSASASGDIGQMLKYLIANPAGVVKGTGYFPAASLSASASPIGNASANTYGNYVAAIASAAADLYIAGIDVVKASATSITYEQIEIAFGAAASEVPQAVFKLEAQSVAAAEKLNPVHLPFPIFVPSGTRVAIRCAASAGSVSIRVHLSCINAADVG